MLFSERQKLEKEYYKWLEENSNVKSCPFNVISFLDMNKNLVSNDEYKKIEILEKALELVCSDLLLEKYNGKITKYRKPVLTIKNYKYKAKKVLEGENHGCKKAKNNVRENHHNDQAII
jgi:hypothetical protein